MPHSHIHKSKLDHFSPSYLAFPKIFVDTKLILFHHFDGLPYTYIYIYIYIYDVNDIYIYTYILFHVFILKDSSPLCFPPAISCEGKTTVPTPFSLRFYDSCSFTWTPFKFNILNASEINDSRTNELYSTLLMTSRNPYTQHQ